MMLGPLQRALLAAGDPDAHELQARLGERRLAASVSAKCALPPSRTMSPVSSSAASSSITASVPAPAFTMITTRRGRSSEATNSAIELRRHEGALVAVGRHQLLGPRRGAVVQGDGVPVPRQVAGEVAAHHGQSCHADATGPSCCRGHAGDATAARQFWRKNDLVESGCGVCGWASYGWQVGTCSSHPESQTDGGRDDTWPRGTQFLLSWMLPSGRSLATTNRPASCRPRPAINGCRAPRTPKPTGGADRPTARQRSRLGSPRGYDPGPDVAPVHPVFVDSSGRRSRQVVKWGG